MLQVVKIYNTAGISFIQGVQRGCRLDVAYVCRCVGIDVYVYLCIYLFLFIISIILFQIFYLFNLYI